MERSASRLAPRTEKILRVTLLGSLSNALLVVLKLTVGILGHSSAMIAEAINSLSDFATDLIALIFIRISGKPQDEDHHYGHGKFETLATLVMAGVMLGVGVSLLYRSLSTTLQLLLGRLVLPQPSRLTLLIAALSLIIKLGLYLYTQRWAHYCQRARSSLRSASAPRSRRRFVVSSTPPRRCRGSTSSIRVASASAMPSRSTSSSRGA